MFLKFTDLEMCIRDSDIVVKRLFGELTVDYSARRVTVGGEPVPLSRREFDIVELLSLNERQIFDRERIYETIWGVDGAGYSNTVLEHIRKVRRCV